MNRYRIVLTYKLQEKIEKYLLKIESNMKCIEADEDGLWIMTEFGPALSIYDCINYNFNFINKDNCESAFDIFAKCIIINIEYQWVPDMEDDPGFFCTEITVKLKSMKEFKKRILFYLTRWRKNQELLK